MLDIFLSTLNSIVPIVLLIILGYVLKRVGFFTKEFVKVANSLVFMVFLPCMIFMSIYDGMGSFSDVPWNFVAYCLMGIVVMFGVGLVVAVLTTKRSDRRGVITQCTFRCNFAIIGLVLITRIGGESAAAIGSMVSAFSAPLCNILSVIALSIFSPKKNKKRGESVNVFEEEIQLSMFMDEKNNRKSKSTKNGMRTVSSASSGQTVKSIVKNIVTNPVIIGAVAALIVVGIRELERAVTGGSVPFTLKDNLTIVYTLLDDLKSVCSPFALIVLGAQFEFKAVKGMTKEIVVGTVLRLVVSPIVAIGGALLLYNYTNFFASGIDFTTLIALFGTPVAVASAVMATNMGSDGQLATQYVVWTSVFSIVTIFVSVFILQYFGYITVV